MHTTFLRATAVALITAGAFLVPGVAAAEPAPNTGSIVGSVTCGAVEDTPAAHIVVGVEGANLQTVTDGNGGFTLTGLPAQQNLTIDAIADPESSVVTNRLNVSVESGQTLNIGSMDLAVCGQPVAPTPVPNMWDDVHDQVGQ